MAKIKKYYPIQGDLFKKMVHLINFSFWILDIQA